MSNQNQMIMVEELSAREVEIVKLVAQGLRNQEIADALQIKEKTVRCHVSNIHSKLNLVDRTQITIWAVQNGFVDMPTVTGEITNAEKEAAIFVAKGLSYNEISQKLMKSERTIRTQICSIYKKLENVNSKTQLALLAISQGWVNAEEVNFA